MNIKINSHYRKRPFCIDDGLHDKLYRDLDSEIEIIEKEETIGGHCGSFNYRDNGLF